VIAVAFRRHWGNKKGGRPQQFMFFPVTFMIAFGAIGILIFLAATRTGIFQGKIKQRGLSLYYQGVKRMIDSENLAVITENEDEEGGEKPPAAD